MYSMAIQLCSNSEGQTFAIDADRVILTLHGLGASFRLRLQAVDRSGKGSRSGEDSGFKYYGTVGGVCAAVVAVMATAIGVYFVRQYRMRQQKQSQANAETIVPLGARS
ncbi:uncharacterized protein LOC101850118 [Aplysia californica]|uniref:Uncharacterized protein LOC101850118 n=1 Tax=Aplysia californica TaxID=6500 RepID=A0ABM0K6E7_APLCA|nr:uncharacterized protein LOC101850118 [Aplysia californica]